MLPTIALLAFAAAGLAGLGTMSLRIHRTALAERMHLLDGIAAELREAQVTAAPDGFPRLIGRTADGRRIGVELIPDTLVTRRLPQLWLVVEVLTPGSDYRPSIGALARATGAEFYSRVHDLPERLDLPAGVELSLLLRTDRRASPMSGKSLAKALNVIFADSGVKEIAAGSRSVRVVRQAAQGVRSSHVAFRQARFEVTTVPTDLVWRSIADAHCFLREIEAGEPQAVRPAA